MGGQRNAEDLLFPACAGVILRQRKRNKRAGPIPRVCGGDPVLSEGVDANGGYSPRVRG